MVENHLNGLSKLDFTQDFPHKYTQYAKLVYMKTKIKNLYTNIFNIQELENNTLLQYLDIAILFSFFVTFYGWISNSAVSIHNYLAGLHTCPPYFPTCGQYYFLDNLPYGYTAGYLYVFLFVILGLSLYNILKKNFALAHFLLLIPFLWKIIWIFLFTYGVAGNYDYYDLALAFVLLFLPHKEYFAKLTFVWLYFLAVTVKIDEGWIFGNYFQALITNAPIFPTFLTPYFTNIVIIMQIVGTWFLLSNNKLWQKIAFVYFLLFHIYSGFIVNYRYMSISIPALVILFGHLSLWPKTKWEILKINRKTILGYGFLLILLMGQFIGILIPGNQKKTLEGNFYGLFMFEAAHQCISTLRIEKSVDSEIQNNYLKSENHIANNRCDPYDYWFEIKNRCERLKKVDPNFVKIAWTFDHSINGHKYERIVDTENACALEYKTFSHNSWIKIDENINSSNLEDRPVKLDIPVYKTGYLAYYDEKLGNNLAHPYINTQLLNILENFYKLLWTIIFLFIISKLLSKTFKK